jgi:hypothetical protein
MQISMQSQKVCKSEGSRVSGLLIILLLFCRQDQIKSRNLKQHYIYKKERK